MSADLDGESTANWHCNQGEFWGTINQILLCARCGQSPRKGVNEPRKYCDVLKPSMHMICDACFEELPE